MAFFLGGVFSSLARSLRRHLRPIFFGTSNTPNPSVKTISKFGAGQLLYTAASIAAVQLTLNFTVAPFMVLDLGKSIAAYHSMSWYGIVLAAIGAGAFRSGAGKWLDKQSGRVRRPKGVTSASDVTDDEVKEKKRRNGELMVPDVEEAEKFAKNATFDDFKKDANDLREEFRQAANDIQEHARKEL